MKKFILIILLLIPLFLLTSQTSLAQKSKSKTYKPKTVRVKGYTTKKGKYVKPHYRSKPTKRKHTYYLSPLAMPKEWAA